MGKYQARAYFVNTLPHFHFRQMSQKPSMNSLMFFMKAFSANFSCGFHPSHSLLLERFAKELSRMRKGKHQILTAELLEKSHL